MADGHLNQLTEMSVMPEALVVTAGTSRPPLSVVGPLLDISAHAAVRTAAAPTPTQRDRLTTSRTVFILSPPTKPSADRHGPMRIRWPMQVSPVESPKREHTPLRRASC